MSKKRSPNSSVLEPVQPVNVLAEPPCVYESDEEFLKEVERRDAEMDANPSATIEINSLEELKALLRKI